MSFIGAAIGGGAALIGGGIKLASGLSQKGQGRRLIKQIGESPQEQIPNAVLQNQGMATLGANVGLPSEQYKQAMQNIQRQQQIQLSKANDRRGGLAVLAGGQQGANDATLGLDVKNAEARMQNQKTLYGVNNQVGQWQDKVWQNNVNNPWMRKYQYGMSLMGAGNNNIAAGADQIGAGLVGGYLGSKGITGGGGGGNYGNYSNYGRRY